MNITGAELVVKALKEEKIDTLFAYPGGQAIDLFHALYGERGIRVITPRHEQGLIHAADGYARTTGKTGVCLVTSGPGATNLVTGIATANMDSVPLVCFTGQVPTGLIGKDSFQEVDTVSIVKTVCKYAVTVRDRKELGSAIKKAFEAAKTGKPGVAVVDLPKDIQQELGPDLYSANGKLRPEADIPPEQIRQVEDILGTCRRPLFLAGGGVNIAHAGKEMTHLAEKTGIPVVTTIMGKGAVPTSHPLYIGNLGIHGSFAANTAVSQCDVLFAIGTRFNDRIIGNADEFARQAVVIHADIEPKMISRNIGVDVPITADAKGVISALSEHAKILDIEDWKNKITLWKQQHPLVLRTKYPDKINAWDVIGEINTIFERAVITTDVGQNQMWTTQFLELNDKKQLITSGGLGTMGYGFPAAIGAKLGNPDKDVISICGDGGFQMNLQEIATAAAYELPVVVCILNNGYLGNVRQWQEMFYDKHYASTCTRYRQSCPLECSGPSADCPEFFPDFVRLAESYGAKGIRVQRTEDIGDALLEAKKTKKVPTVIEFILGREDNVLPIVPPGNPLNSMIE